MHIDIDIFKRTFLSPYSYIQGRRVGLAVRETENNYYIFLPLFILQAFNVPNFDK